MKDLLPLDKVETANRYNSRQSEHDETDSDNGCGAGGVQRCSYHLHHARLQLVYRRTARPRYPRLFFSQPGDGGAGRWGRGG